MAVNAEQNQQYNQSQDDKENQQPNTGAGAAETNGNQAPAANGSRVASFSSGSQPGSTGSGRFTNLQKYIGANQGAGERLGAGIENKVSNQNQVAEKQADTSASAVRQGIQSAQDKLNTGNQYKEQVSSNNFNAADIAGDENKLNDFTQYRTGSAIDEAMLAKQNQAAQDAAMAYQNQMQQQLGQTQTDQGRYGLLKQAFGGGSVYQNPYSQGQQRLDQLFLQSGGGNKIGDLQNQLRTGLVGAGQQVNQLTGEVTNNINDITTNEAAQSKAIQDAITGKTSDYVTGIESTQADVNAKRASDQQWATDQYAKLQAGQPIDPKFAQMLGLTQGQSLNNAISDKNVNNFVKYGATNLQGADQLANADQRQYYSALGKLAGIDPSQYAIRNDYTPEAAITALSGDSSLSSTLTNAQKALAAQNSVVNPVWGGSFTTNLGDVMNQVNASQYNPNQDLLNRIASGDWNTYAPAINELTNDPFHTGIIGNIANSGVVKTGTGINNEALMGGAAQTSVMEALRQLANSGYFNTVKFAPTEDQESGGQFGVT